jgi:hypothetical protein
MPPPWTPRDIAVGNNLLPLYQMLDTHRRWFNRGLPVKPATAPAPEAPSDISPFAQSQFQPIAHVPPEMQPARPVTPTPIQRPPAELIRRQTMPMPAAAPVPGPQQPSQSAPTPAPVASGLAQALNGMTAEEKSRMRNAALAGAAGSLSDLLARRPNAGIGICCWRPAAAGSPGRNRLIRAFSPDSPYGLPKSVFLTRKPRQEKAVRGSSASSPAAGARLHRHPESYFEIILAD